MIISTIEQRILPGSQFTGSNGGAMGTVTTVAGSALVVGESFFLHDGFVEVEYRFVTAVTDVAQTNVLRAVAFSVAYTADQIRDAIVAAVNSTPGFDLMASGTVASTVDLLNRHPGHVGNKTPTSDTVVDAAFVVSPMIGGVLPPSFSDVDGVRIYAAEVFGGVLELPLGVPFHADGVRGVSVGVWTIDRVLLMLTGATSYTLDLVMPDGTSSSLSAGAGGVVLLADVAKVMAGERVVLTTVGGTLAMSARISGRPLVMQ